VVTGAGHFLAEACDFLSRAPDAAFDVYFTRAGREVAARYGMADRFASCGHEVFFEGDFSSSASVFFAGGRYGALVIAPATANTVAKCALGVADSLASNFFAQAGKSGVPIFVLPTDAEAEIISKTASGRYITVRPRPVDLARARELASFPGVIVLRAPEELETALDQIHIRFPLQGD
jgi:flavoprotein